MANRVCFRAEDDIAEHPMKLWDSICRKPIFSFAQLPPWRDCGGRQGICSLEGIAPIWYPPGSCASL